jgi:hypothetical protein
LLIAGGDVGGVGGCVSIVVMDLDSSVVAIGPLVGVGDVVSV